MGSLEPKGPICRLDSIFFSPIDFPRIFAREKLCICCRFSPFPPPWKPEAFVEPFLCGSRPCGKFSPISPRTLSATAFKRLVFLDFSNYNWILKHAVRELNLNRESIQAVWVNPKEFAKAAAKTEMLPDYGGGAVETSLAFSLNANGSILPLRIFPRIGQEYLDYMGLEPVAPKGFWVSHPRCG